MVHQNRIEILARGQWQYIHPALGIPREWMTKTGKPCLMCGGTDRSMYDDREGRGTYLCRQCGAGDGFTLLQKYHGWNFKQTADEVRQVLGVSENTVRTQKADKGPLPNPPPKPPKTSDYARQLWKNACTDDAFVASHPYAVKKRITGACGAGRGDVSGKLVGRDSDCLIVPQRTVKGVFCGVECINHEGVKQSFSRKGILVLGNDLDPGLPMVVFEGWASACKWLDHRKWNACGVVSFGKSRQESVGTELEAHYHREVLIAEEVD